MKFLEGWVTKAGLVSGETRGRGILLFVNNSALFYITNQKDSKVWDLRVREGDDWRWDFF